MKKFLLILLSFIIYQSSFSGAAAQQRRPIDNEHPLWLVHVDVWNTADPQKIIDLIPDDIKPYVCMNLSLSCGYDKERNVYKMPRCAVRTYKSWATVCQANGLWFTCQPASGGHTHIQDDDLATFEYFFKRFPNFLGWNYAEQFWGFDEPGDKSSSTQTSRWALFAKLVEMSHQYGGFLTVSFCGNIWSHPLNPIGEMKRNQRLLEACRKYPEAILWLYKYTTSSCFYNNESVTISPFISGLAANYGVRYDNCGWNGAMEAIVGENKCKYPVAAGIGTVMEQTGINGGAVWDGPELIWTEDFQNLNNSTVDGYTRRNWGTFPGFRNIWIDMFRKILDGTLRIPSREEVVNRTKIIVINDRSTGSDEDKYAAWGSLYDGLYKQTDPMNRGNGQWMDNFCYFKKTGRYAAIPVAIGLYDDLAKSIPVQVKKSNYTSRWSTQAKKVAEFNEQYPEVSTGDLFVARMGNQLVTYTPYSYLNKKVTASATIPLQYNSCESLQLTYGKLSTGLIREYADHIDFYLNNFRTDTTAMVTDRIVITGAAAEPAFTATKRESAILETKSSWDAATASLTIEVTHMGPVDLTVKTVASPAAPEGGESDAPLVAPPLWSSEGAFPIIIEAEDMDYKNVAGVSLANSGWYFPDIVEFSGNGFVDMGTNTSAALRHQLNCRHAGEYNIAVRYTCTSKEGNIMMLVNGKRQTKKFAKTARNEWRKVSFNATLKEGKNNLTITNQGGLPMYIDQIIYTPAGMEEERFLVTVREADHGAVTSDVAEAAEGETVTLTVSPGEGYQLKELRVVNSVYYTMAKTISVTPGTDQITFTMPDDNVTLQPVFGEMSSAYKADFANVIAGTLPEGWRCVQENDVVHEYPNSYSQGARTFNGFTGDYGKALYWREVMAEYGALAKYPLSLQPGKYKLTYAMAAWKGEPAYKVQIVPLLKEGTGVVTASSPVYTAAPNAGGDTSANLSAAEQRTLSFDVKEAGNYIIRFTNESSNTGGLHEFLLLECRLNKTGETTAVFDLTDKGQMINDNSQNSVLYDLQGRRIQSPKKGQVIILRSADGQSKKLKIQN